MVPEINRITNGSDRKPNFHGQKPSEIFWRPSPANGGFFIWRKRRQNHQRKTGAEDISIGELDSSFPKDIICWCDNIIRQPQNAKANYSHDPFYYYWNFGLIIMFFIISDKLCHVHSKQIGANPSVGLNIDVVEPWAIAGLRI